MASGCERRDWRQRRLFFAASQVGLPVDCDSATLVRHQQRMILPTNKGHAAKRLVVFELFARKLKPA